MRFEFYTEALDTVPKLSVDGTVDNSIHFSHWQGNTTPAEVKADTSTEIALNLVEHRPAASWGSADHLHPLIEAKKLAFSVRDRVLADPARPTTDLWKEMASAPHLDGVCHPAVATANYAYRTPRS